MNFAGLLKKKEKAEKTESGNFWLKMLISALKTSLLAVVATVTLFLLAAFAMYIFGIDDEATAIFVTVIRILSVALGGLLCGRSSQKLGWLAGLATGLFYVIFTVIIGLFFYEDFSFDGILIVDIATALGAGAISGMIGINLKK